MNKVKIQLDESQEKIKTYQDECFSFSGKIKSLEDKNGFMDKSGCSCSAYRNFIFSSSFDLIHLKDHDSFNGNFINEYKSNYHT